jgi:hypothetical protein
MKTPLEEKQFLTTTEAGQLCGMTTLKVRMLCEQGRLPSINTTTATRPRWTIRRCDLDEFLTPDPVKKTQGKQATESRRQRIDANVPKVFR